MNKCTKCLLPDNFPIISFDQDGVCNYCRTHEKITVKGDDILEQKLREFRNKGKVADCIVTYSGGRDSSYVIHEIVKKYKLKAIAVTYDWGIMAPEAKENWKNMKSKLGVEHIIIEPNIKRTIKHIKKNILAWAHRPHIGMLSMLKQADKQAEYHINKLAKQMEIPLVITGAHGGFEVTYFKAASFGGTKNIEESVEKGNKYGIVFQYIKELIRNPRYSPASLIDLVKGYYTQTFLSHRIFDKGNWMHFFEYHYWNENEILTTIKEGLNYYSCEDMPYLTWRTDDYTPPFYNYVNYSMVGYTENDTLRSIQIREGVLSRSEAIEIVYKENITRWKPMMGYFKRLGLSRDEILFILNAIPNNFVHPEDEEYSKYLPL